MRRESTSLLYNGNPFKLGIFCMNVSGGTAMTTAAGTLTPTWAENVRIAQAADRAGWEFLLPLGRWRGLGGKIDFNGRSFEVYTWAAAIGAITSQIQVFATSHVPIVAPLMAAKQATTIDHITNGRFAVNVVAGWNEAEFGMFGLTQRDHDDRYEAADEWMTVIKRLWTEEAEFDFDGKYYHVKRGYMQPKPIQQPYPVVVNAGTSPAGKHFGAKHADFTFQTNADIDELRELNRAARAVAWDEYHREIGILAHGYVVCRPTEKEALEYVHYYVDEHGDWETSEQLINGLISGRGAHIPPEIRTRKQRELMAGWGGVPLVGTAEQIVDKMVQLHQAGVNGIALHWVNYEAGIQQFNTEVLPLMIQAGLRKSPCQIQPKLS